MHRDSVAIEKQRVTKFIHDFEKQILFVFGNEKYSQKFLQEIMIKLFKFKETHLDQLIKQHKLAMDTASKQVKQKLAIAFAGNKGHLNPK